MESTENSSPTNTPLRRARVACKACNARRVKCDADKGRPCWHCRMRRINCELIESRRGKYARRIPAPSRDHRGPRQPQQGRVTSGGQATRRDALPDMSSNTTAYIPGDGARSGPILGQSYRVEGIESLHTRKDQQTPPHQLQDGRIQPHHENQPEEPSTLYYVIDLTYGPEGGSTEPLKVHHPIPLAIADQSVLDCRARLESPVSLHEAFTLPARGVVDQLISTFFEKIHPAYPVFDREKFAQSYLVGQASPLVLQTIILLGFTIGSDDLIRAAGFSDRVTARKTHYLRAKALYDADHETDHLNLVAVLLLLGFWWAGPEDQKDTCYWVGCAITLSQSLGMHRSTAPSAMSQRVRSLRRRIWWSIYTRDRHTAAAFGRPCRIRDEDCDVEPLTEEDLTFDIKYDQKLILAQRDYHVSYVLEMSKLAVILGDILVGEFSPHRASLEKFKSECLARRLAQWESGLQDRLRNKESDGYMGASFWASMLQFSYQNCIILLFRPKVIENLSPAETERDLRARTAADSITRLAEDLLAARMINSGLIHLVPALFSALSIHTIVICRKDLIHRQLAENKSRQCMLALSVIAKSWPVKVWIAKSFVNLMKRLTDQGPTSRGSILNISSSIVTSSHSMAPLGQIGLQALQNASPRSIKKQFSPNRLEPSSYCTCTTGAQPGGLHAHSCFWNAPNQFVHDSLWAGYVDNSFDIDLFLQNSVDPMQYVSFDGSNAAGEPSASI